MVEIGGYFGLDLPKFGNCFPDMLKYQSARAALRAVLEHVKPSALLLPAYICDSVVQAVVDAGVQPKFYCLDGQLFPKDLPGAAPGCCLLYVNYFGLNDRNVSGLLKRWPRDKMIIDNSQALFSRPTDAIAAIYSPRKFLGLPDGGLLCAPRLAMVEPDEEDVESLDRMKHLLLRAACSAQAGYPAYLAAEQTLQKTKPLAMSKVTRRLLSGVDMGSIKTKRRENFRILSARLNHCNAIREVLDADAAPLCYPLMLAGHDVAQIKTKMIRNNIFLPTYWKEAGARAGAGSIEAQLVNNTLFLPVDQRVNSQDLDAVCSVLELEGIK